MNVNMRPHYIRFNSGVADWYSRLPHVFQDLFAAAWVRYTITGEEPPENVIPAEVWKYLKELVAVIYSNGQTCGYGGARYFGSAYFAIQRVMDYFAMDRVMDNWNKAVSR